VRKIPALLIGVLLGASPMLMAPTGGGFPSQPTFQSLTVNSGSGASAVDIRSDVNVAQKVRNTLSTGYTTWRLYNDQNSSARALEFDYSGSAYATAIISGGTVGESAALTTTGAFPLCVGTNNICRLNISSAGDVAIGGKINVGNGGGTAVAARIRDASLVSTTTGANLVAAVGVNTSGADVTFNLTDGVANNGYISYKSGVFSFQPVTAGTVAATVDASGMTVGGFRVPKTSYAQLIGGAGTCTVSGATQNFGTCSRTAAGQYSASFTVAYTTGPVCTTSAQFGTTFVGVVSSTPSGITLETNFAGAATDGFASVICVGN
jgi:hypothetical protein